MNLKQLANKPQRFAPGHRSCSGCGFPQIVRTVLASTDNPVVVANATGCLEVTSTIYPFTSWKVPYIHSAFENAAATITGVESAYKALQKRGKLKDRITLKDKKIKFVAFGGDGGTYDIGLQSLSGALERGHDFLYVLYDNEAYMNCLSLDTFIMTKYGLKRITDINVGEMIYAFDNKTHGLVLKKCSGVFNNGIKPVYKVNTLHHDIKATPNHPFLTIKRRGRGKKPLFVWKTLSKLKVGDEIITLKDLKEEKSFRFNSIKISKKGDYKVNKIHKVNIPNFSSEELMTFLGLYVGDGWVRENKAHTGFALPKGTEGRNILIKASRNIFDIEPNKSDRNYVYIHSVNIARFINSMGFGSCAKNKIIPNWIFTLPKNEKNAFLRGLMLSDGYIIGKSHRYVSASFDLLRTLRLLLQTMGYRVGKIHSQTKKKGTFVVYRTLLEDSTYGYICFSKKPIPNVKKYLSQIKQRDLFVNNNYFSTEKITEITYVKEEPTLDLRVDGEHNFIADGIVVHNTGVQRSSSTPFGASTTTAPDGTVHHGKEEWKKDIMKIVEAHHIPYLAQASVHNLIDLSMKAEKAFSTDGPSFIVVLQPCTLGWKFPTDMTIDIAKLAVETKFWPLYEIENGKYKLNYKPVKDIPVTEYLKTQGRFKHLFRPENKGILEQIQQTVNERWNELVKKCGE